MNKKMLIMVASFLTLSALIGGILVYNSQKKETNTLFSPLPDFLTLTKNSQVSTLSLFVPILTDVLANENSAPVIQAEVALVYDLTTKKVLFEKNPTTRHPMASLTKIMTAIVALENPKKDDKYIVTESALVGEDSMGLSAGEVLTLKELLYGLMLPSGNDAAETLATNYSKGRESFVEAMNSKASALGLENTNFTNPSGLQGDGDQYTTAYDLLVITTYALEKFPLLRSIVSTPEYVIEDTINHKAFYLENETNLLTTYPGVRGVKTGYTPEAGMCLVTFLEYKNHKIISIIMGSNNRRQEMKELLDYSLKIQGTTPPKHS